MCCSKAGAPYMRFWGTKPLHPDILSRFHFSDVLAESQGSLSILRTSLLQSSTPEAEIPNTERGWLAAQKTKIWKYMLLSSALAVHWQWICLSLFNINSKKTIYHHKTALSFIELALPNKIVFSPRHSCAVLFLVQ